MFIPVGDSPNLPKTPWLTWFLIALNVAIHVSLWPLDFEAPRRDDPLLREYVTVLAVERGVEVSRVSAGDLVRYRWGSKPDQLSLVTIVTSMFLHGGLAHLLGNMLFLWIFGDNVEHRLGWAGFLLAYLATGGLAALGDTALRWGSSIPSVGASGAISGVLGFYFAWFPRNRVRVFVFLFPIWMDILELPARFVLGIYVVIDNLLPLLLTGGAGGVSYGAHIGGFVAGLALASPLGALGRPPRRPVATGGGTPGSMPGAVSLTLTDQLRDQLASGRLGEAAALLFRLPRTRTRLELGPGEKIALGEALEQSGEARWALAAFQRALADHPQGPGRSRAHLGAARVLLDAFSSPTAAYQHLYAAMEDDPSPAEATEARRLLTELERGTRHLPKTPW